MKTSEWCRKKYEECLDRGDSSGAKAYQELYALWSKREKDKEGASMCVCGKSPTANCVGLCATGE